MAGLLLFVDSLLNRCYLLVCRLGLGLGLVLGLALGLALGLQLGIGIGFRRNHSWSSTFMPRRNDSLCLFNFSWPTTSTCQFRESTTANRLYIC